MTDGIEALELDPHVVPIDDNEDLVPVDAWLATLLHEEPLVGAPSAAEMVAQARAGE